MYIIDWSIVINRVMLTDMKKQIDGEQVRCEDR